MRLGEKQQEEHQSHSFSREALAAESHCPDRRHWLSVARRSSFRRMTEQLVYDRLVERGGLAEAHLMAIKEVPVGSRVLDVGCASGYVAEDLRHNKGCTVDGLEYDAGAVEQARARGVNARQIDLNAEPINGDGYDVVIFADVLEHLIDPVGVLASVRDASRVIVSLPNITHWTARRNVLLGHWPQDDHGIFDKTHLHYFDQAAAHKLAHDAGFEVARQQVTEWLLPYEQRLKLKREWRRKAADRWPALFGFQWVLTLR
jgi:methionine biosynthesis protein MetW